MHKHCPFGWDRSFHSYNAWWRHQMETFSTQLALCAGNSLVPVNSPHKGQWRGALMFSLICIWINGWVNNPEAGDLRRHRGHYDVNVMGESNDAAITPFHSTHLQYAIVNTSHCMHQPGFLLGRADLQRHSKSTFHWVGQSPFCIAMTREWQWGDICNK